MTGRIWLNTAQAADHSGKHADTIRKALEDGVLHGHQRVTGGRWSVHIDCLDAWVEGRACARHEAVAS